MSSMRSVVLLRRNGLRYFSTAGLTQSGRWGKGAHPYPYRPAWSVVILTTVRRTPAGAHSITLTSLMRGTGIPRVARAAWSCAFCSRGRESPISPAAPMVFSKSRRRKGILASQRKLDFRIRQSALPPRKPVQMPRTTAVPASTAALDELAGRELGVEFDLLDLQPLGFPAVLHPAQQVRHGHSALILVLAQPDLGNGVAGQVRHHQRVVCLAVDEEADCEIARALSFQRVGCTAIRGRGVVDVCELDGEAGPVREQERKKITGERPSQVLAAGAELRPRRALDHRALNLRIGRHAEVGPLLVAVETAHHGGTSHGRRHLRAQTARHAPAQLDRLLTEKLIGKLDAQSQVAEDGPIGGLAGDRQALHGRKPAAAQRLPRLTENVVRRRLRDGHDRERQQQKYLTHSQLFLSVLPERALDRCPAAKPGSGRWDCRPVKSHALVVVYISRQNRGLAATLGVENGRLGKSGADAVVRARPPGRTLALIVNSYAGQVTSQPANFSVSELRQHRVTGRVADIHGSIMILLNRAMIDWRPYGIGAIVIQVSGGDSQEGAGVPGTPARPENACAAV